MDLEHLIELILPPIIGVLEMMGIFPAEIAVSAVRAFAEYLGNTFLHRHYALQFRLATAPCPQAGLKWPPRS